MRVRSFLPVALLLTATPAGADCPDPGPPPALTQLVDTLLDGRHRARRVSFPSLGADVFDLDAAYAVQASLACRLSASLGPVAGYKIAFSSPAVQQRFGMDAPAFAPLFRSQTVEDGGDVSVTDFAEERFFVEAEIAFTLERAVEAPVADVDELRRFVRLVHVALEMPEQRFDWSEGTASGFVADAIGAHRFAVGAGTPPAEVDLAGLALVAERDGAPVQQGPAANVMGGPWQALLWLANELVRRDAPLAAGQIVLSGAAAPAWSAQGARARGSYVGRAGVLAPVRCEVR